MVVREDTPDAPSQSTTSGFSHTVKKPAKQGKKRVRPAASPAQKKKSKANPGQMSQLRKDEEGTCIYMYIVHFNSIGARQAINP